MIVDTTGPDGAPWCPICHEPVNRPGEFCSPGCWEEFHLIVYEAGDPYIAMDYLDLTEQPWYGKHYG